MIYRLRHTTTYEYHESVSLSQHVLRLRPRDSARQTCLDFQVSISPSPRSIESRTDYFGNAVASFACCRCLMRSTPPRWTRCAVPS